ncbi:hypothetical protein EVAR_86852_1 [Eumeta japonica]|uniref:Uncharacterized protein n=1 Tax=Eumeta variegata TaxID=151549 RepID=A0A4C1VU61_EUMVA|nr:hypothetical protein EVAR_86852_1 [Eumeta japonica]
MEQKDLFIPFNEPRVTSHTRICERAKPTMPVRVPLTEAGMSFLFYKNTRIVLHAYVIACNPSLGRFLVRRLVRMRARIRLDTLTDQRAAGNIKRSMGFSDR